jgi:Uncharacterized protein conserved in bacteria (DUF2136).
LPTEDANQIYECLLTFRIQFFGKYFLIWNNVCIFAIKTVFLRFVGTHKEYDDIKDIQNI